MNNSRVLVKYVKAARMWCKTTFTPELDAKKNPTGKITQKQEWFAEKPKV